MFKNPDRRCVAGAVAAALAADAPCAPASTHVCLENDEPFWRRVFLLVGLMVVAALTAAPVAFAETGGYPDWNMPCSHSPYARTGTCPNYDWGPTPGGAASTTYSSRGYGYRNCTDWAAWRLQQMGVPPTATRGLGNGKQWGNNAAARGVSVTSMPEPGDAAVRLSGTYGHVAVVESVNGGEITVSQYNNGAIGEYSTQTGTPASLGFQQFAHFGASPGPAQSATPPPAPHGRMAFSNDQGAFFRTSGSAPWQQMAGPGASSVAVDGQSMAMVVPWQGAIFRLNDSSPWTTITAPSTHPTSVAVSDGGRMAFSNDQGAFFRTSGSAPWQQMAGPGASSVAVDGQSMAMVVPWQGAIFRLNDSSPWTTITAPSTHPTSVAVSDGGRMAFSNDQGAFFRTSGSAPWQQMAGPGASSVAVDGQSMAMVVPWQGAIFRLNDSSPWTTITAPSTHPTSVAIFAQ